MIAQPDSLIVVLCTCPTAEEAERLAQLLVSEKLAACVQIEPVRSVYRWQGQVEGEAELRLSIKTSAAHFERVQDAICRSHSYAVPQILALPIAEVSADYAAWLRDNLA